MPPTAFVFSMVKNPPSIRALTTGLVSSRFSSCSGEAAAITGKRSRAFWTCGWMAGIAFLRLRGDAVPMDNSFAPVLVKRDTLPVRLAACVGSGLRPIVPLPSAGSRVPPRPRRPVDAQDQGGRGEDNRAGERHGGERDDDGEQTDKRWQTMTASSRPRPISWVNR